MKISIAMATYNGAQYLGEQLQSFARQSCPPDELVVCDDGSTDGTIEILKKFEATCHFSVRIFLNERNIGYSKNFEKALSLCTGDLIFLSDQDDVWFDNKLESVRRIMSLSENFHVLVNDQEITDGNLVPSGRTIFNNTKALGNKEDWITAGCCTAITSHFRDIAVPFPSDLVAHDGWIHRLAVALRTRYVLREVLQYYRRHEQNTSSPIAAGSFRPNRWESILAYGLRDASTGWATEIAISNFLILRLSESMSFIQEMKISDGDVNSASNYEAQRIGALQERICIVRSGVIERFFYVMKFYLFGKYRFFSGWKSAIKDLIR